MPATGTSTIIGSVPKGKLCSPFDVGAAVHLYPTTTTSSSVKCGETLFGPYDEHGLESWTILPGGERNPIPNRGTPSQYRHLSNLTSTARKNRLVLGETVEPMAFIPLPATDN